MTGPERHSAGQQARIEILPQHTASHSGVAVTASQQERVLLSPRSLSACTERSKALLSLSPHRSMHPRQLREKPCNRSRGRPHHQRPAPQAKRWSAGTHKHAGSNVMQVSHWAKATARCTLAPKGVCVAPGKSHSKSPNKTRGEQNRLAPTQTRMHATRCARLLVPTLSPNGSVSTMEDGPKTACVCKPLRVAYTPLNAVWLATALQGMYASSTPPKHGRHGFHAGEACHRQADT